MTSKHYLEELAYLDAFRRIVAEENADLAPFLAHRGNDPDVERLFEGFAFLTSRIRRRIDDEFPQLVQGLLSYWWPQLLQPIPAMCIMRFDPQAGTPATLLKAGTEIQSVPVDETPCLFRTSHPLTVVPFRSESARLTDQADGAIIELNLTQTAPVLPDDPIADLRLFLHGDGSPQVAQTLFMWMAKYLHQIDGQLIKEGQPTAQVCLPRSAMHLAGLTDNGVIPQAENTYAGYRVLQEYFCFPEKFQFVDVTGLKQLFLQATDTVNDSLRLRFHFRRRFHSLLNLSAESILTNCVPAANVFRTSARPINVDHSKTEYPVEPENKRDNEIELFAVDRVRALFPGTSESGEYLKFESMENNKNADYYGYYRTRIEPREVDNKIITYLSLKPFASNHVSEEVLSIDLRATNGDLPSVLNPGDVHRHTPSSPGFAEFENITKPSRYVPQPTNPEYLWRMISNMSMNYRTALEPEALRGILRAYDALGQVDAVARRKTKEVLDHLNVASTKSVQRLHRGCPVRGIQTNLTLRSRHFSTPGDMYLFGSVLETFLGLLASVNSFHELNVKDLDQNESFRWQPRIGQRSLL